MANPSISKRPASPKAAGQRSVVKVDLATAIPRDRWLKRLVILSVISIVVHLISFRELLDLGERHAKKSLPQQQKVTIHMVPKQQTPDEKLKSILEAKQDKTEKPKDANHLGEVDHQAKKETRVDTTKAHEKNLDPGRTLAKQKPVPQPAQPKIANQVKPNQQKIAPKTKLGINGQQSVYSSLMPTAEELSKQVDAGYVGYVNDKVALGDAVDINTTEFRFIGYFTNLRKAIELVWNYPYEAAMRGMQGNVGLVFTINKDGSTEKIKVINSSGYKILDQAIVDAVGLASPFAPLPASLKKEKLTIKGNFTYTLGNMIGGY